MFEDFSLSVSMPLGPPSDGDFTALQNAYLLETPYGLRQELGPEMELSHAIGVSTPDDISIDRLNAIIRGRLRFAPATATETAQLYLQPLPFEQVQLRERLHPTATPDLIIYGNVEPTSVLEAVRLLADAAGFAGAEATTFENEFLLGNRWLTVDAGAFLGRPAIDAALSGRRRVDVMIKDRFGFFLNPACFLFEWPTIQPFLEDHPLLLALEPMQHRMLFASKSRKLYVKQAGGNQPPFASVASAATAIGDALVEAQPGDVVVVLDAANYPERLNMPSGVQLISKALSGSPWRTVEDASGFPTVSGPGPGVSGSTVVFEDLSSPSGISGFIITGGNGRDGYGVRIARCTGVEIAHNKIHLNGGPAPGITDPPDVLGGGIAVFDSGAVAIERNHILDNGTQSHFGGGVSFRKSKGKLDYNTISGNIGSGVTVAEARQLLISKNRILQNRANSSGGGISIWGSRDIRVVENLVSANEANVVGGKGGGLSLADSEVYLEKNIIEKNVAHTFGGGIAVVGSHGTARKGPLVVIKTNTVGGLMPADGNRVSGNALDLFDAIWLRNPQGGGGGIGVFDADVKIVENQILNNKAHRGGGIEFYANGAGLVEHNTIKLNRTRPPLTVQFIKGGTGGGIAINRIGISKDDVALYEPVNLVDNTIEENSAGADGGGVYATAGAAVTISGTFHRIRKNTAGDDGGGVRATFGVKLSISSGEIVENKCNLSNGHGAGGGVSFRNAIVKITTCQILRNSVNSFAGGGVSAATIPEPGGLPGVISAESVLEDAYECPRSELEIVSCTIQNNRSEGALGAGGGVYVLYDRFDVRVHITNSTLAPNLAEHTQPEKAKSLVIQDGSFNPKPIVNDDNFTELSPLTSYDQIFEP
jgi:parallel beta-helix repeat protein